MKFYNYLYVGDGVKKKLTKIRFRLRIRAMQAKIYVIFLSDGEDLLEIMDSVFLKQNYYRRKKIFVVGIAKGKEEAMELVAKIVSDAYKTLGTCDMKKALREQRNIKTGNE